MPRFDYQEVLREIHQEVQPLIGRGKLPTYIPALAEISPDKFGLALHTVDGQASHVGDSSERFSIQSISKLFSLTLALRLRGAKTWERVGREPSGTSFNSLVQLEYERGRPRNPFINAGALVTSDILLEHLDAPQDNYLDFMRHLSGIPDLRHDEEIFQAEITSAYRNRAMANLLKDFGNLSHAVDDVLEFYCFQCSIMMSCQELAASCLFLANQGVSSLCGEVLPRRKAKRVNSVMLMCGTYDAAGDFAFRVGLPGKSGVAGGIVAVVPGKMSLCVWSPALNEVGNSYAGTKALELFTTKTRLSIF
ncbi:MAG: glutaminase [Desulfuromonas sp.]|nr:MAG: glutaminase [Desulfuromonas sp.]